MTANTIRDLLSSKEVPDARLIALQASQRRPLPVLTYAGQDLDALKRGLNPYEKHPKSTFPFTPSVKLFLRTIHNAQLIVSDGLDGVIVTLNGQAIEEPSCFSNLVTTSHRRNIDDIPLHDTKFEDIFVAFDGAWGNYYHWLLYGLAKASIAYPLLPEGCRIVIPDYRAREGRYRLTFSETTYEQTIRAVGAVTVAGGRPSADWVDRLQPGRYRARRIHYLWTEPKLPTDILYMDRFHQVFAEMRANLARTQRHPKRLLVSRAKAADARMSASDQALIERLAFDRGFERIFLEDMSHNDQAEAFFNADAVLAPHGAGLANLLFGQRTLRVLEINSDLDQSGYIRACFYQLAAQRGLTYLFLNASAGDLNIENLNRALELLCR